MASALTGRCRERRRRQCAARALASQHGLRQLELRGQATAGQVVSLDHASPGRAAEGLPEVRIVEQPANTFDQGLAVEEIEQQSVAAVLQVLRQWNWHPWVTRRRPILWILHAAYAWLAVGLVAGLSSRGVAIVADGEDLIEADHGENLLQTAVAAA